MWEPSPTYPDPAVVALDPRFHKYRLFNAAVERIATGLRWGEGPVWFGDGRYLLVSDIPNDRILRWDEASGTVSTFRAPSNKANGNSRDRQGRLVTCEHGGRRVVRTEYDGAITVIADSYGGRRLNSPNDVVVKSDGSVWFTDPVFGLSSFYEGAVTAPDLPQNVYRVDEDGTIACVVADVAGPNGLCFSPDERTFYLVESRAQPHRAISAWDVSADGRTVANRRLLIDAGPDGTPDGLRVDIDGNLWCGWGMGTPELDGVRIFAPDGTAIGHIRLPERCANVCFGGRHRDRLFMATGRGVYALYVNTQGAAGG